MPKIEAKTVFSTCLIGDRAKEGSMLSFFTVPCGQHMPQVPADATRCSACQQPASRVLGPEQTNIMQAGQLGSSIGDARFDRIRAQLIGGDPTVLEATVKLFIAGKTVLETTLAKLIAGWVQLEDDSWSVDKTKKVPFVLVACTDTVEARLTLTNGVRIVGEPIAVCLSIQGKFISSGGSIDELMKA